MKKNLFILSLLCSLMVNAQVMPTYTPQSYDSYARPFQEYARAFRQAEAQINDLTNIVINALAENIDEMARRDFNSDYDRLQSLSENLHKNGLSQGIWSGINSVRTSINNHIVSYNERARRQEAIEEARRQEEARARQKEQEQAEEAKRKAGWSGSGFALTQGHIVTNYHVIENAKTVLVKGIKGDFVTEYRASVVATDKINDIAIIKISDDRFKGFGATPYKIKRAMSDVGESVWALGYPMVGVMGDEVKFTDGKISARTGIQGDMSVYQISVPIQPGNSGGPLFDNYGNIVGITSSGLNREAFNSENVNYAIKTSYLYNLIESSMSASILPQGTAMQGQSLTEKIKLAKKFVYIILCSEDPNFHSSTAPKSNENKQTSHSDKSEQRHEMKRIETKSMGLVRIEYPTFQSQDNELKVLEVSIDSHETIIKCSWQNNTYNPYGWCNISPKVYVQCKKTSNKYNLKYPIGIPLSPDRESVVYGKYQTFSLVFNAIPIDTESIDLIEPGDSSWKVYNIKLR